MTLNSNSIGCAVIKVEKNNNMPVEIGKIKDGIKFRVRYEDIENIIKFINLTLNDLGMNNYTTYLTGFEIVNNNDISTKERIIESIMYESGKNIYKEAKNSVHHK